MTKIRSVVMNAGHGSTCPDCRHYISRGEQITVLFPPRRTLCYDCGRKWRARQAAIEEAQRAAAALAKKDPKD